MCENLIPSFELAHPNEDGYGNFSEVKHLRMIENVRNIEKKIHISCLKEKIEEIDFLIRCGWIKKVDYKHEGDLVYIDIEEIQA